MVPFERGGEKPVKISGPSSSPSPNLILNLNLNFGLGAFESPKAKVKVDAKGQHTHTHTTQLTANESSNQLFQQEVKLICLSIRRQTLILYTK